MTILKNLEKYVNSDDIENINSIIQTLLINYQCNNNPKPINNNNNKQKETKNFLFHRKYETMFIEYINNSHKKSDIIQEFLGEAKIIEKDYLNILKKKANATNALNTNTINFIKHINSENLYTELAKILLSYGFTNEKFFVESLISDDYCNFIKTNYIDYDDCFELYIEEILSEIISLSNMSNYYNNNNKKKVNINVLLKNLFSNYVLKSDIMDKILFTNAPNIIKKIFAIAKNPENFELEPVYFEIFLNLELFSSVLDLLKKNKIKELNKCYCILCEYIKFLPNNNTKHYIGNINNIIVHPQDEIILNDFKSNKYLGDSDKEILLEIYEIFLNKNFFDYNNFNYFFKKNYLDYVDLCVKKNKYPTETNFVYYLINSRDDENKYFQHIIFNEEHLYLACLHKKINIIKEILNQKVKPTKKCFNALFQITFFYNSNSNYFEDLISKIIELFILYSYKFDKNDLLVTINKKIKINTNLITKLIKLDEDLKLKIYDISHADFTPEYWDELYKDINWVHKMCKMATKNEDFKKIRMLLKSEKINLDKQSYLYLKLNKSICGEKTELLCSYKIFHKI